MAKHELAVAQQNRVLAGQVERLARAIAAIAGLEDELIELRVYLEDVRPAALAVLANATVEDMADTNVRCARAVLAVLERLGAVGVVTGD